MKTAISLPDELFQQAESLAKREKLSRSELYARALAQYLDQRQEEALLERLNRTLPAQEVAAIAAPLRSRARRGILANEWE